MKNDELDDLKALWHNAQPSESTQQQVELQQLLHQKSGTTFTRMRRMLYNEALLGLFILIGWIGYVATHPPIHQEAYLAAAQCTLLALPLIYFYLLGFQHLQQPTADERLLSTLQRSVAYWDIALRLYFWGGVIIYPVFLLSISWYQSALRGEGLLQITENCTWMSILFRVSFITLIASLTTKWLIRHSYEKHLNALKAHLRELEEL
jgi:hypothetical protein